MNIMYSNRKKHISNSHTSPIKPFFFCKKFQNTAVIRILMVPPFYLAHKNPPDTPAGGPFLMERFYVIFQHIRQLFVRFEAGSKGNEAEIEIIVTSFGNFFRKDRPYFLDGTAVS